MSITQFLMISIGSYALLRFFLVPVAADRWKAEKTADVIKKASVMAGLKFCRNAALMATIAGVMALALVAVFNVTPTMLGAALEVVVGLRSTVGAAMGRLSTFTFVVLVLALAYYSSRLGKRKMSDVYEASMRRELNRLQEELDAGRWEELPPTEVMEAVAAELARLDALKQAVIGGQLEAPESARDEVAKAEEELRRRWVMLDWERRMEPKWGDDIFDSEEPKTLRRRFTETILSKGSLDTAGDFAKALGTIASILLFLSLIGMNGVPVAETAEARLVAISDLEVKQAMEEAIRSALLEGTAKPAEDDDEVADALARAFEDSFLSSANPPAGGPQARAAIYGLRALRARSAVLAETAAGRRTGLRASRAAGGATELSAFQRQALAEFEDAALTRRPRTEMGRRLATEIRESGLARTSVWNRLRSEFRVRGAAFRAPVPMDDLANQMFGRVLNMAAGEAMPDATTDVGRLAGRLQRNVGTGAVRQAFETLQNQYLADIAAGVDLDTALERVALDTPRRRVATTATVDRLRSVARQTPRSIDIFERSGSPRLAWTEAGDFDAAVARSQHLVPRGNQRAATQVAEGFASFETYFPGSARTAAENSRTRAVRSLARGGGMNSMELVRLANPATHSARVASSFARRAMNFRALRGFSRIGGVLIGEEPNASATLDIVDVNWRVNGTELRLTLVDREGETHGIGPFDAGDAHLALAYAADGRPVAATMVASLGGLKVLLHPALVDTSLGADMIHLDRFVDTWRGTARGGEVERVHTQHARVEAHEALYRLATVARVYSALDAVQRAEVEPLRAELLQEAELRLMQVDVDANGLADARQSPLTAKPEFFDRELVAAMGPCLQGNGVFAFATCIGRKFADASPKAAWTILPDKIEVWSGVRENGYAVDEEFAFLDSRTDEPPLSFMLQIAFPAAPEFTGLSEEAKLTYVDPDPWIFPTIAEVVNEETKDWASSRSEERRVLRRIDAFVLLQRLFRSALNGHLGYDFPIERLATLARDTRELVEDGETARWSTPIETQFVYVLDEVRGQADGYDELAVVLRPGIRACRAFLRDSQHAAEVTVAEWDEHCDFAPYYERADAACAAAGQSADLGCAFATLAQLSDVRQVRRTLVDR